jgi:hypothetical protein
MLHLLCRTAVRQLSAKNLLLLRVLIFAVIPLVIAAIGMRASGIAIDRKTLRQPFHSQCFLVTPFALMLQSAIALYLLPGNSRLAGSILGFIAFLWFAWAQTGWFSSRLNIARSVAALWAVAAILAAVLTGGAITYLVARSL